MVYRTIEPFSKQLTIIVGLTVVGFMAFGLALSFYRNILFEERLKEYGEQNKKLEAEITTQEQSLDYYRSAQFKDKYAKESMGLVNPGEKVLILTEDPEHPLDTGKTLSEQEAKQAAYEEILRQMPILEHWKLYLFHKDKLEQLREGL
jgi:cell division protein FtsB